jgi:hypothetical protein
MTSTQNEINVANFINAGNKLIVTIDGQKVECVNVTVQRYTYTNKTFLSGAIQGLITMPGNRAALEALLAGKGAVPGIEYEPRTLIDAGDENKREFKIQISAASATKATDKGGEAVPDTSCFSHIIYRVGDTVNELFSITYMALDAHVVQGGRTIIDWVGLDETRNTDVLGSGIIFRTNVS